MITALLLAGVTLGSCRVDFRVEQTMPSQYAFKYSLTCDGSVSPGGVPAVGYAAWFDAGESIFQDGPGTTPAVADGDPVANWQSKGGSYGALPLTVLFNAPTLKTGANGINGKPVVRAAQATFDTLHYPSDNAIFEGGVLNVGEGTVFAVVRRSSIDGFGSAWGDSGGYVRSGLYDLAGTDTAQSYLFDTGGRNANLAPVPAGTYVLTWHHAGGTLYSGANDTRTASMASVSAADMDTAAGSLQLFPAYMNGDLAELIFYPTALSESDRQLTENYLANKYGITLPY